MKEQHPDPLDHLLRQWAERHASAEADAERLHGRIAAAVGDNAFVDLPPATPVHRHVWGWALAFALGAAVAVVVMVALRARDGQRLPESLPGGLAGNVPACDVPGSDVPGSDVPASDVPRSAFFAQSELAEKAKVLAAMQDLFAGRLAWVGETGREVQLGLLPDAAAGARPGLDRTRAPLAVRVVVLARPSGGAWKPIWQADVIARDEEVVDLAAQDARDGSLRLWMHALPDGAIAVDADLALKGAPCVRSAFSGIQQTGVPQRVFGSQTGDAEYQVYQTVAPLQANKSS